MQVTSAEKALFLVKMRRYSKIDMEAVQVMAQHVDAANLSIGDLDEAAWLAKALDNARAEGMGEALEICRMVGPVSGHAEQAIAERQAALRSGE